MSLIKKMVVLSILLLLASSAMAGDKRFCGYQAFNQPTTTPGVTVNLAAGVWMDKDKAGYSTYCSGAVDKVKSKLKNKGLWDSYNWDKKEGYKCSNTKSNFGGTNICSSDCMKKDYDAGYNVNYVPATGKLTCERT